MSSKREYTLEELAVHTLRVLRSIGLLLVCQPEGDKPNVMTIGWGMLGVLWGRPIFVIAVRPSRYTFELLERAGDFTINVPSRGMENVVSYCGTVSGRNRDKFKECNFTAVPSKSVHSPIIQECIIHYECKILYKTDLVAKALPKVILDEWYPQNDYHRLYVGEILHVYADEDYLEKLP